MAKNLGDYPIGAKDDSFAPYNEKEKEIEEFKKRMYEFMQLKDIKSIKTEAFNITRVDPSKSYSFDSAKFKEEHSILYKKYIKEGNRKGYAKITLKGKTNNNF